MEDSNNKKEQDEQLREMNYSPSEDIYNKEDALSLDENGNLVENQELNEEMDMNQDVPGSELDNAQEMIGSEDEENNYWSLSDNKDDHEETNEDIIN